MSRARQLFWAASLIIIVLIAYLNFFYFDFANTKNRECGNGNMTSCYELGFAYYNGMHELKKDLPTALTYIQKACEGKYAQGCQYLGGVTADLQNSTNYYDLACSYGSLDSCYRLGILYRDQPSENLSKSFSYFENLCKQDYKRSCYGVAFVSIKDEAPPNIKNYKKALSIFENLCDKNDFEACYAAGWLYYMGKVESSQSLAKSLYYFAKSCENGYNNGCKVIDMHKNALKNFEENQKLCESGSIKDCAQAAQAYKNGRTVQKDFDKAASYYAKACDEYDHAKSCENAYFTYKQHDLVNKMRYALKACDKKIYKACINVGDLYLHMYEHALDYRLAYFENPDILPKDPQKALYYYKKAYENGIDDGYYKTGMAYYREKAIYDLKAAAKYLKIVCDKSDGHGCFYLSEVYASGKDMQNAMIYAKKGCDLNNTGACDQVTWLKKKLNK
ncbi:MAG: sel1 repeat family protein [Campylobacteraceae bacterium]|nr:sel1 repeat family protein [Campylobacteraceae bacterium]